MRKPCKFKNKNPRATDIFSKTAKYLTLIFSVQIIILCFPAMAQVSNAPDIKMLQSMLKERKFTELEEKINSFSGTNRDGRDNLSICIMDLPFTGTEGFFVKENDIDDSLLEYIDQWCKSSPINYIPFAVRAQFYIFKAQKEFNRRMKEKTSQDTNAFSSGKDNLHSPGISLPEESGYIQDTKYIRLLTIDAQKNFKKSGRDLDTALKLNPLSCDVYALLIRKARFSKQDINGAEELYQKASLINPSHTELNTEMLLTYINSGEKLDKKALDFARKILKQNPGQPAIAILLDYIHYKIARQSGDVKQYYSQDVYDEIARGYLEAIGKYPESEYLINKFSYFTGKSGRFNSTTPPAANFGDFYLWRGLYEEETGNIDTALADYAYAIDKGRWFPEFNNNLAAACRGRARIFMQYKNSPAQALPEITRSIKLDRSNPDSYFLSSQVKASLGDKQGAINDISSAISLAPYKSEFYNLRGELYYSARVYHKAMGNFEHAITLEPKNFLAFYNRALIKANVKEYIDYPQAWDDFKEALRLAPDFAQAWFNLALLADKQDKSDEAEKYYSRAIELDPGLTDAYIKRAKNREKKNKFQDALSDYNTAINKTPQDPSLYFSRGMLLWQKLDDLNAASDDLIKAAQTTQDRNTVIENLVLLGDDLALKRRDYKRAIEIYDTEIKLEPKHPWAYNSKAWLLVAVNSPHENTEEGIKLAQKAVSLLDKAERKDITRYAAALDTISKAYSRKGDLNNAIKFGKKSAILDSGSAEASHSLRVLWIRWWKRLIAWILKIGFALTIIYLVIKRIRRPKTDPWADETE